MKLLAFTVHDSKADAFLRPYFADTVGLAVRAITEAVNDPSHDFHKHAEDFTMYEIGYFDPIKGVIVPREKGPVVVCQLLSLRADSLPNPMALEA